MNFFDEILSRSNIQDLRSFLLNGGTNMKYTSRNYCERLTEAKDVVKQLLFKKLSSPSEHQEVMDKVIDLLAVYEDVHIEVGLQCGFRLATQLLLKTDNKPESS